MKNLFYIVAIFIAFTSCKPGIPSNVLSEGQMVDILYDMHLAQALSERGNIVKDQKEVITLRASVLEKYGVSQADWDSSYVFYCGHSDYLFEVYQKLDTRLNEDVEALGGQINGITEGDAADTANIWHMDPYCILMQQAPYDKMTFTIVPDTTVRVGDRINLQYDSQLIFQDGLRDVTVSLNLYFDNDSIATRTNHISSDGRGIISISTDSLRVKKITGFFLMTQSAGPDWAQNNITSFRLASIRNIKLLHLPENVRERMGPMEQNGSTPPPMPSSQATSPKPDTLPIRHQVQ